MILRLQEDQSPLAEFEILWGLSQRTSLSGLYLFGFQIKEGDTEESMGN